MYLVAVGCDCQVPECAMRQWFSTGCYTQRSKTAFDIAGAIIVAVNLAFAKSQSDGNAPDQMTDIEAAQFGLVSLPLNFWAVGSIANLNRSVQNSSMSSSYTNGDMMYRRYS